MASSFVFSALIVCSLSTLGPALGAVTSPDALSSNTTSVQSAGDNSSSVPPPPSTSAPSSSPASAVSTSPSVSAVPSGGGSNSNAPSSVPGTSSVDLGSVSYDMKSMANPQWVTFLEDVARQTSRDLADLQNNAVNDPQIAIMWDVYVQTLSEGAGLPSSGSGNTKQSSSSGSSTGSSYVAQDAPVMTMYEAGGQKDGTASAPSMNNDWFQTFFKDGTAGAGASPMMSALGQQNSAQSQSPSSYNSGSSSNSYGSASSSQPSYNTQYRSPGSSGPSYTSMSRNSQSSGFGGSSVAQMFSQFRPSSSSRYQQQQRYSSQQPRPMGWGGTNSRNIAERFVSMVSPVLLQSLSSQTPQYRSQQSSSWGGSQYGQSSSLPDTGWGMGGMTAPRSTTPPPRSLPKLSNETMDRLSMELLMLLGKVTTPPPSANIPSASPGQQGPPAQSGVQYQIQTTTQATPVSTPPATPGTPVFSAQTLNAPTNQVQSSGKQNTGVLSALVNLGTQMSGLMMSAQRQQQQQLQQQTPQQKLQPLDASSSVGLNTPPLDALPPVGLNTPPLDIASVRLNALQPVVQLYNARFNARASRDLGCRTLAEMLDMDVPRPLDMNCNRLCPAMMPGAVTGKRFGLTCLCCPVYVSDRAIGIRSMYRRAEALT